MRTFTRTTYEVDDRSNISGREVAHRLKKKRKTHISVKPIHYLFRLESNKMFLIVKYTNMATRFLCIRNIYLVIPVLIYLNSNNYCSSIKSSIIFYKYVASSSLFAYI